MNDIESTMQPQALGAQWCWRVARRPMVWFLSIWLGLSGAFVLVQLTLGVPWGEIGAEAPPPAGIDYAQFLGDGRRAPSIPLSTPANAVPAFDSSQTPSGFRVRVEAGDDASRLAAERAWRADLGWPHRIGGVRGWTAYDVTDPRERFGRLAGRWDSASMAARDESGSAMLFARDGSGYAILTIDAKPLVIWLGVFLALALVPLLIAWWTRAVVRRRLQNGRCAWCAHRLDPARRAQSMRCPECGAPVGERPPIQPDTADPARWQVRPGVLLAIVWLFLIGVFVVLNMAFADDRHPTNLTRELASRRDTLIMWPGAGESPLRVTLGRRDYGWPVAVVSAQHDQWFKFGDDSHFVPCDVPYDAAVYVQPSGARSDRTWMVRPVAGDPGRATVYQIDVWLLALWLLVLLVAAGLVALLYMTIWFQFNRRAWHRADRTA